MASSDNTTVALRAPAVARNCMGPEFSADILSAIRVRSTCKGCTIQNNAGHSTHLGRCRFHPRQSEHHSAHALCAGRPKRQPQLPPKRTGPCPACPRLGRQPPHRVWQPWAPLLEVTTVSFCFASPSFQLPCLFPCPFPCTDPLRAKHRSISNTDVPSLDHFSKSWPRICSGQ